jgi:hypothetical protein
VIGSYWRVGSSRAVHVFEAPYLGYRHSACGSELLARVEAAMRPEAPGE